MTKRTLTLPPIQTWSKRYTFGRVMYVLRPEETLEIAGSSDMAISARRTATVFKLSNGESVVILEKKLAVRPAHIDGILYRNTDGSVRWGAHNLLETFASDYGEDWAKLRKDVNESWKNATSYRREKRGKDGKVIDKGLRPPQVGALHAIGAHWSINNNPATIVMPTGTGKTESMLAALANYIDGTVLVVVPTRALRDQTARKFKTFGLLRELQCLSKTALNPVVGVIEHRVKDPQELEVLKHCNVLIATINTVAQGEAIAIAKDLSGICSHLIFDEAHHVPADTYSAFKDIFKEKLILQFTATPFRRDGKDLEGKTIFSYPLGQAQQDGYFKPIKFKALFDLQEKRADTTIAESAIQQLQDDIDAGFDHLLMTRCSTADRARDVFKIYADKAKKFNPVLVISEEPRDNRASINKLKARQTRVVVCVNMLGEGFDLPELKIAAVHDTHKSIAILLQFAGRFTRDAGDKVGEATVFANIANQNVSSALERLYGEDADWNKLLSEFSSSHVKDYTEMIEFIRDSQRIDLPAENDEDAFVVPPNRLRPSFSATIFRADSFNPQKFVEAIAKHVIIRGAWINKNKNVLYFVTEQHLRTKWTASKTIKDRQWDLYVFYFNKAQKTLFVHCSDTDAPLSQLAVAVGGQATTALTGDVPFRCLSGILRLMFQNIGLKKPGRRNLRYSMYSGADVVNALSSAEKSTSVKVNASAHGYANGEPVNVACSAKGRVWSKDRGRIPELLKFCDEVGAKLNDDAIDVEKIIENVMIPKQVKKLPKEQVFCIDWPHEFYSNPEESTKFKSKAGEFSLSQYSLHFADPLNNQKTIQFDIIHQTHSARFELKLEKNERGFTVTQISGDPLMVQKGKLSFNLDEYFNEYPPSVLYVDGSELDGCYHISPKDRVTATFPVDRLDPWTWTGVSIKVESMWHNGVQRVNSVQEHVADALKGGYEIVFDDDDPGEAADLVLLRENGVIELVFVHCKFSGGKTPGERIKDVVEVSTQAVRSSKRIWKFDDLITHLLKRESNQLGGRQTRFIKGSARLLALYKKASKHKEIQTKVVIVQPGLSKQNITEDQSIVLAAAETHLLQIAGINLDVICSK